MLINVVSFCLYHSLYLTQASVTDDQLVKMMGIFIVWYITFPCGHQNSIPSINREKYKY